MLRRKRRVNDWSHSKLARHVIAAYVSDPELEQVKAAIVLDQDPASLPKVVWTDARRYAEREGREFRGIPPYVVFLMAFDYKDHDDVFLDDSYRGLVRNWEECFGLAEAHAAAAGWVVSGERPGMQTTFDGIPGVYRAAFVQCVSGSVLDLGASLFVWFVNDVNGNSLFARRWPSP